MNFGGSSELPREKQSCTAYPKSNKVRQYQMFAAHFGELVQVHALNCFSVPAVTRSVPCDPLVSRAWLEFLAQISWCGELIWSRGV